MTVLRVRLAQAPEHLLQAYRRLRRGDSAAQDVRLQRTQARALSLPDTLTGQEEAFGEAFGETTEDCVGQATTPTSSRNSLKGLSMLPSEGLQRREA